MKNLFALILIMSLFFIQSCSVSPKIVAHRGAWKNTDLPENSIASLVAATEQEVWGVELDVHLTRDDSIVVNHDLEFYGIDTEDSDYEDLLVKKHPNGENIPLLRDFLLEAKKHEKVQVVLEIKTNKHGVERTEKLTEMCVDLVRELGMKKQVDYISFSWEACLKVRELDKNAAVYYLDHVNNDKKELNKSLEEIKDAGLTGIDYYQEAFYANPDLIKEAKELKLKTDAWTVNDEKTMRYLIDKKVDFITTNEPELLRKVLDKK